MHHPALRQRHESATGGALAFRFSLVPDLFLYLLHVPTLYDSWRVCAPVLTLTSAFAEHCANFPLLTEQGGSTLIVHCMLLFFHLPHYNP